ncbi:MerR family transcriptional regulator [Microbulbifer agarilyticus]|uniref:MerR family transcriptional regulator n=1 Tax=Microbulbifer agarilyticus TaxID=260552 RepID=UPI001C9610C8|nr:MerR family transcriptional regulator [Microbulbifer agarilyticus]MBY6213030.1 MerR family transcriptional regulator [Microbulbifer agarilyticus]
MLTVTQLARTFGISRATILYYEREGLLLPANRSENGYRWYGEKEVERLRMIVSYRSYGIPVASIAALIDRRGESQAQILKAHFKELEQEIQLLRAQQKAVVALLQEPNMMEENMVTKERWVEIMRAAGFDDDAMIKWHQKFEEMEPEEHQKFLASLGIDQEEIEKIRKF